MEVYPREAVDFFWKHTAQSDGCWIWKAAVRRRKNRKPELRVTVKIPGRKNPATFLARRIAFAIVRGPVDVDTVIASTCGNELCVRPDHLTAGPKQSSITPDGLKVCSRCHVPKSLSEYKPDPNSLSKLKVFNYCRPCHAEYMRSKDFLSTSTEYRLKRTLDTYGLSIGDYQRMASDQRGKCAICGGNNGARRLAVDHDHDTGAVRALLCGKCNAGIAMFKHDATKLLSAVDYVLKWNGKITGMHEQQVLSLDSDVTTCYEHMPPSP